MHKIILLHGALGSSDDMKPLETLLIQQQFTPVSFSFSGHGNENFQRDFGIDQFTRELEDYIIQNKLQGSLVFGYSMGGYVALTLAARNKDLIGGIVTLGTKFNWTKEVIQREANNCNAEFLTERVPAFANQLQSKHKNWKELLIRSKEMIQYFDSSNFLDESILKKIEIPVLLGVGDNDKMVTLNETLVVREHLTKSAMYMLPFTKHPLDQADMKILTGVLTAFSKKINPKRS